MNPHDKVVVFIITSLDNWNLSLNQFSVLYFVLSSKLFAIAFLLICFKMKCFQEKEKSKLDLKSFWGRLFYILAMLPSNAGFPNFFNQTLRGIRNISKLNPVQVYLISHLAPYQRAIWCLIQILELIRILNVKINNVYNYGAKIGHFLVNIFKKKRINQDGRISFIINFHLL